MIGVAIKTEDSTNQGQIDKTVEYNNCVYLFEFKVIERLDQATGEVCKSLGKGTALAQIKKKNYAAKYRTGENQIFLIGVEFGEKDRNILCFEWEESA